MSIALIQGAGRGLGLEFARVLSLRPNVQVIATCRQPEKSTGLQELSGVDVQALDVNQEGQIHKLSEYVQGKYGKVDFLLNSSGMLHPSGRGETRLADVDLTGIQETFMVNTFAPLMMAKHFTPVLKKGSGSFGAKSADGKQTHSAVMASLSARVGSIGDNRLGGWYSYRMSKTALNMANRNLAVEFGRGKNQIICLALHPGTVDTDISRPYHKNVPKDQLFSVEHSVKQLLDLVDNATLKDSGRYMDYSGTDIPF
ncbi:hypothetical protein TCAL_08956 [Tigriopus californicus]|uniref:Uncharacterized protein n=1 Tax=Tigriopus californicus TaxID=6832 RepID=A0A553PR34_TIGCA|nr:C-signal-like [Tigriopus californicus]XP_059084469.1 C-signal-like [Tigriopus californicus]TRY80130.1 hypothetical protein TCAL_08956 [Tigriopus californicus]|eukprot:TCALIF_08956-PA protein Name:"Similar to SPCC663.09c Uncharacterized oxidoreductase C663.09c (Schizosaccharomyces pombe (strain 972 / ATCC 24843))" AED:0.05 eAED:0.05 QI:0/0/0/1/1/1/2/0/255